MKKYTDEDFHAFIVCLLLAKDEFISRNNISDLIDLLNNIRVSLSLDPVAGSSESLNLEQYLNNDARHFICSRNGCVSFISQNAMDSVFLAFKDLFKLKKILFDLLLVNRRFLVRYCRTAEYKEKKNELLSTSVHVKLNCSFFAWDLILLTIQFWRIKQHMQLFVRDVRKRNFLAF